MKDGNRILLADSDMINIKSLNKSFSALLQNDVDLTVRGKLVPGLWEQRWYNDRENTSLYYGVGDAVWINTESIDDIVKKRADDLYAYSAGNALLKKQLDEYKDAEDMAAYYAKLKEFALGKVDQRKGPIYWLGELTANAQIRISKIANNTLFPDDDVGWENFIWDSSIENVQLSILNYQNDLTEHSISVHNNQYHLADDSISKQQLADTYLFKDFSNISNIQKFKSHFWNVQTMNGFDHVKAYQHKKSAPELIRWFKLWDSGYLEHGGIVDVNNPVEDDSFNNTSKTYRVNLNWKYNETFACPIYDYPSAGFQQFYGRDDKYAVGQSVIDIPESYLGTTYHYAVAVTPICNNTVPYATLANGIYDSVDICFIDNDGFSFTFPNMNCTKFIYSVRGFTMKGVRT